MVMEMRSWRCVINYSSSAVVRVPCVTCTLTVITVVVSDTGGMPADQD